MVLLMQRRWGVDGVDFVPKRDGNFRVWQFRAELMT
jgi:hypothetical protein